MYVLYGAYVCVDVYGVCVCVSAFMGYGYRKGVKEVMRRDK